MNLYWHGCSVRQQSFDCSDEVGAAFDELDDFVGTWRRGLVIAFLAGVLGATGEGAEALIELAGRDEDLAEASRCRCGSLRTPPALRERLGPPRASRSRRR